jgi:hypothetical protein
LSIYNNATPYGDKTGGYWILTSDNAATFASNGAASYSTKNSFTFNYNTISGSTGQKYSNGFSNLVYAYYVEPQYTLTTSASNDYPTNKFVNVNTGTNATVNFNMSSGVTNKTYIANSFNYTSTITMYAIQAGGGTLPIPFGSNTITVPSSATDPSNTSNLFTVSIPVVIKSSYRVNSSYINMKQIFINK